MDLKKDVPQLSKADKESKRKANSFRRDPFTQTKLKSFFKKSSEASTDRTPPESDDDGSDLVIDENNEDDNNECHVNSNDTTLKLKDIKDEVMNADGDSQNVDATTVKSVDSKYSSGKESKTFVINITLQGIPNKHKNTCNVDNEHDVENNEKQNHKTKIKQEIDRKSHKSKPPSKRKIKALFGESSDSDGETRSSKKIKTAHRTDKSDRKHKHSKKNNAKESNKHNHKKHDTSTESTTLFGQSDEESEKELVIDDGSDLMISKSAEDTLILSDIKNDQVDTNPIDSDDIKNDNDTSLEENKSSSSLDHMGSDDANFNKARKLSLEADAVLQKLQMFKDPPPKSEPLETMPDVEQIEALVTIKSSPIQSKHKDKNKSVTKHKLSLGKKIKEDRKTKEGRSEKHKTDKPHRKESKHRSKNDANKNKETTTKKTEKVDLAGLVVKLLMPYYKKKKISSRDLFKTTARHIVHQLLAIQVTGKLQQYLWAHKTQEIFK